MGKPKMNPNVVSLIGLVLILGVALISDRIVWQLERQATDSLNYPLVYWAKTASILLLGIACALVAWYLFTQLPGARLHGWLYLVAGLLLLVYPQLYLSQNSLIKAVVNRMLVVFNYLAMYHGSNSLLQISGGMIAGIGLIWLLTGTRNLNKG